MVSLCISIMTFWSREAIPCTLCIGCRYAQFRLCMHHATKWTLLFWLIPALYLPCALFLGCMHIWWLNLHRLQANYPSVKYKEMLLYCSVQLSRFPAAIGKNSTLLFPAESINEKNRFKDTSYTWCLTWHQSLWFEFRDTSNSSLNNAANSTKLKANRR